MKNIPLKYIFAAIFCNMLFGSAVPMIKLGYAEFNITDDMFAKILFAGVRFFISGIIILIVDILRDKKFPKINRENRANIILVALIYTFLQYIFNYIGLSNTTGSSATIIIATSAFISVIFAHFFYKDDKLNMRKVLGSVIGFVGVIIACSNTGFEKLSFFGEGFMFISAVCFVVGSMFNKKASAYNSSFTISAYNLLLGGGLLAVVGFIGCDTEFTFSLKGALILAYLIMVSSVGFTLWSTLLKICPIGKLGIYNFVIPVSGAILSGIILKENVFNLKYLLAIILVSVGIIAVNIQKKQLK